MKAAVSSPRAAPNHSSVAGVEGVLLPAAEIDQRLELPGRRRAAPPPPHPPDPPRPPWCRAAPEASPEPAPARRARPARPWSRCSGDSWDGRCSSVARTAAVSLPLPRSLTSAGAVLARPPGARRHCRGGGQARREALPDLGHPQLLGRRETDHLSRGTESRSATAARCGLRWALASRSSLVAATRTRLSGVGEVPPGCGRPPPSPRPRHRRWPPPCRAPSAPGCRGDHPLPPRPLRLGHLGEPVARQVGERRLRRSSPLRQVDLEEVEGPRPSGVCETRTSFRRPVRALIIDDFPTLLRPTNATSGAGGHRPARRGDRGGDEAGVEDPDHFSARGGVGAARFCRSAVQWSIAFSFSANWKGFRRGRGGLVAAAAALLRGIEQPHQPGQLGVLHHVGRRVVLATSVAGLAADGHHPLIGEVRGVAGGAAGVVLLLGGERFHRPGVLRGPPDGVGLGVAALAALRPRKSAAPANRRSGEPPRRPPSEVRVGGAWMGRELTGAARPLASAAVPGS